MLRKFLVTGASGQIGQELIPFMQARYGASSVIVSDIHKVAYKTPTPPQFIRLDVSKPKRFRHVMEELKPTHIVHLAALLSAKAEQHVSESLDVNIEGLHNVLELAKDFKAAVYVPSSIAAFGPDSPRNPTPDDCIAKPTTVYGISKVYSELLGNYYHKKFGVDFRSLRYPGAISVTRPTGGTTDYAVEIFHELLEKGKYDCFLNPTTRLPMMYMDDLLRGTCEFIDAPEAKLTRRVYNLAAISFTPEEMLAEIKKHLPDAQVTYTPDVRQKYADSWPMVLDDALARKDWGWNHTFNLQKIVPEMITQIKTRKEKEIADAARLVEQAKEKAAEKARMQLEKAKEKAEKAAEKAANPPVKKEKVVKN